ncbi:melanopsin-like [Clytia hemisphaerica]|uniref:melanopsin-like n=1 Tax=Clytia hemisphaerica TaxID=252671 RepID=UPI0034D59A06
MAPMTYAEVCLGSIGALLNSIQIIYILCKKRKSNVERFLLSISVADILTCATSLIAVVLSLKLKNSHIITSSIDEVNFSLAAISGMNVTSLTLDKYFAIFHPFKHRVVVSGKRITKFLILLWIFGLALGLTGFSLWWEEVLVRFNIYFLYAAVILACVTCIFVYGSIMTKMCRCGAVKSRADPSHQRKKSFRTLIICFITSFLFLGISGPILYDMNGNGSPIIFTFLDCNAIANSLAYFVFLLVNFLCSSSTSTTEGRCRAATTETTQ